MAAFINIVNTNLSLFFCLSAAAASFSACSGSGSGKMDNPFGDPTGTPAVEATFTSNADSVFLSWKLVDDVDFDSYAISDQYRKNSIRLGKDATECVLTHIPYNERVNVSISLVSGADTVNVTAVPVQIDGLDTSIASKIIPDKGSVVEGDGMYSIYLGDGRSIFLMGDSYIGEVSGGRRISGDHMYRNTYSVYDHEKQTSYALAEVNGPNTSAAVPAGVTDEGSRWYWPGHGFAVGNNLYIFQQVMFSGDGPAGWNFYYDETHILQYSLPDLPLKPVRDVAIPFKDNPPLTPSPETPLIHFGAAALNDLDGTGFLYIYAQTDIENDIDPVTEVYVARTTETGLFSSWEYWNGSSWSPDQNSVAALSGLSSVPVSSQFNVFKLEDKYVLIAQNKTWNSGEIYTFTSDNPWGSWGHKTLIYKIPGLASPNWYSYNAMAHPQFEKDGMILISYNVNTSEFAEQKTNVESYRPRFFWVEKDMILNR